MMKGITIVILLGAVCFLAAPVCNAVPPAYEGQFGNPEEPALRVVKWPWLGLRKMVMHTHDGLKCGIQCSPCAAVHEGAKGAAHGGCILLDHTGRGIIYSKLPPKGPLRPGPSYEERAMHYIEQKTGGGLPPDVSNAEYITCPVCRAEAEKARKLSPPEGGPYLTAKFKEPAKFKAQRRYVGDRTLQRDRALARRENLLKYAR